MQRLQQVVSFFGAEAVLPIPERNPTFLIRKWLLAHKMSATCRLLLCTPGWSSSTVLLESLASEAEKRGGRAPKTQPCSTALTIAPTVPTSNLFNSGSYHTDRDIAALAGWFESQSAMGQGPGLDSEMRRLGGPWHSPQGVVWKLQPLDLSTRREISRSPKGGNLADER